MNNMDIFQDLKELLDIIIYWIETSWREVPQSISNSNTVIIRKTLILRIKGYDGK